jgi:putative flippase GtrA
MATRLNVSNDTFGQLVRFAIVGFSLAGVYSAIYWYLATYVMAPVLAVVIAFVVSVSLGFVFHSRWSFRGHGERGNVAKTGGRFFAVSLVSLGLNSLFVWVLTEDSMLNGAWWWPLIPILFVTPLVTFALNRIWVFG